MDLATWMELVLLSGAQQGVNSAESYLTLPQDEEPVGRDQNLCRIIMLSIRGAYIKI